MDEPKITGSPGSWLRGPAHGSGLPRFTEAPGEGAFRSASASDTIPADIRRATAILRKCELFKDLGKHHLREIAEIAENWSIPADCLLLRAGDPSRHLFVVEDGRGVAQLDLDSGRLSLGLVGPGDAVGWTALIDGQTYPGSVRALTPMAAIRLATRDLSLLMGLNCAIGYPVHRRLSALFCRQYRAALEAFRAGA